MRIFFLSCCIAAQAAASPPRNFGVVVRNEQHTIYRSGALGSRGLSALSEYLRDEGLPFPEIVIHMNRHGYRYLLPYPSHFALEELAEAQSYGYQYFHAYSYGYRTYLDGLNPFAPRHDIDKPIYLRRAYRELFGFRVDNAVDGGMDAFYRILDLVLGASVPVLFHCTGGMHRTGMIALAIRYIEGGEWLTGRREVIAAGRKVALNRAQYEYYLHNKALFRRENLAFVEAWAQSVRFVDYRRRYRGEL